MATRLVRWWSKPHSRERDLASPCPTPSRRRGACPCPTRAAEFCVPPRIRSCSADRGRETPPRDGTLPLPGRPRLHRGPCESRGPTVVPWRSAVSRILPPRSVNLAALVRRFVKTWVNRTASASRRTGSAGKVTESLWACASMRDGRPVRRPRSPSPSVIGALRSVILLCVMRATSSRSSTSRVI
jgi:hypothetical protein